MAEFDPSTHPHRRLNPLTNEYILVSPHRVKRPWQGQNELPQPTFLPPHDPACFLCPGNTRASGKNNEVYDHTMLFENDYAAVFQPPGPIEPAARHPLLNAEPVQGGCDVLIFHPRHDLTLARLPVDDILRIVDQWIQVYKKRGAEEGVKYVQIFENKGALMGCSNPHPHGQIWSLSTVPQIPAQELASLRQYAESTIATPDAPHGPSGRPCLLCEYIHFELTVPHDEGRIVIKNQDWVALVPWWATFPFETLVLPYKTHIPSIVHLSASEKLSLADIVSKITKRYDNLFSCSFAYSMGIHQRPLPPSIFDLVTEDEEENIAHLHLHFFPPLLRSASVRKFTVGFELLAEAQRDLTAEEAAKRLRVCDEIHYLDRQDVSKVSER